MGIATTRYEDRILAATGCGGNAVVKFERHDAVANGGVLFMLPALIEMGLFKTEEVYQVPQTDYYGLQHIILTLAMMALLRIPNPEQLKQCKPGELGKIIGLDRVPEVRCLREKIQLLSSQKQAQTLNNKLVDHWNESYPDNDLFLYVDGHVRIYFGDKANLPVKYVSRQKLCLNATTEFWVNDMTGLPIMMVMGELTEKLQHAIEYQIIPQLQKTKLLPAAASDPIPLNIPQETPEPTAKRQQLQLIFPNVEPLAVPVVASEPIPSVNPEQAPATLPATENQIPLCTFVFDREGYDIPFFNRMWDIYKAAILTYHKNVKDTWPVEAFQAADIQVINNTVNMLICEREVTLGGTVFREVRRLTPSGHQTSIMTNNRLISTETIAGRMFSRWSQENCFRYLKSDYNLDKIVEYGTEQIDMEKEVVNPEYRKINHKLKKHREKLRRLQASLTAIQDQNMSVALDKMAEIEQQIWILTEKIESHKVIEKQILEEREKNNKTN